RLPCRQGLRLPGRGSPSRQLSPRHRVLAPDAAVPLSGSIRRGGQAGDPGGTGVLAGKLASRFARVTGINADAGMAAAAGARLAGEPRVSIMRLIPANLTSIAATTL